MMLITMIKIIITNVIQGVQENCVFPELNFDYINLEKINLMLIPSPGLPC